MSTFIFFYAGGLLAVFSPESKIQASDLTDTYVILSLDSGKRFTSLPLRGPGYTYRASEFTFCRSYCFIWLLKFWVFKEVFENKFKVCNRFDCLNDSSGFFSEGWFFSENNLGFFPELIYCLRIIYPKT